MFLSSQFIESIFTIILYLDTLMMLVSLFFSFILLSRAKGNLVYFNFGLSILFLGVWMFVTLVDFFGLTPFSSVLHAKLGFLVGIWILHYFLLFTFYFPFPRRFSKLSIYFLYLVTLAMSIVTMMTASISSASVAFPFRIRVINVYYLTIYIIYFGFLMSWSLFNLLKSFGDGEGVSKIKTKKILVGTSLAMAANLVFSLINFYYSDFDLTSVGMFFSFAVLIYIYVILFFKEQY